MAVAVVTVASGGLPVTNVTNGFGLPVEEASNGRGLAVTYVTSGGLPVARGGVIGTNTTYLVWPYSAYLQSFGVAGVTVTQQATLTPAFPNGTQASWSVSGGDASTVKSYLGVVNYGNYFGTSAQGTHIPPAQIKNISALTGTHSISFTGTNFNVMYDIFLSPDVDGIAHPCEIEIMLHASSAAQSWFLTLTTIGTTTISGISWDVKKSADAVQQIVFMQTSRADIPTGTIDLLAMLNYLVTTSTISSSSLFYHGHGFGVESIAGSGTITINSFSITYTPTVPIQANYITQQAVNNTYWTKNAVTAPNTTTIMETAVTSPHGFSSTVPVTRTAGVKKFIYSMDVEGVGATQRDLLLSIYDGAWAISALARFNVAARTSEWWGSDWPGEFAYCTAIPGSNAARCMLQFTTDAVTTGFNLNPQLQIGDTNSYLGDVTKGMKITNIYLYNVAAGSGGS